MKETENSIIGSWSMVETWDIGDDPAKSKQKTYPWGNPSEGYWVYDKSGHFSLMISQNPALPIPEDPFTCNAQPDWLSPCAPWEVPHNLLLDTFSKANPYAYFGTYTVEMDTCNPTNGNIIHEVFADVLHAYTGNKQIRPFSFDGPNIKNVGTPGQYLRKLERLT
jgi:hypothetical protein